MGGSLRQASERLLEERSAVLSEAADVHVAAHAAGVVLFCGAEARSEWRFVEIGSSAEDGCENWIPLPRFPLLISEVEAPKGRGDDQTGCTVWPCSEELIGWLCSDAFRASDFSTALELGAGLGVVS
eukprot:2362197-Prymnesium_polylepis.1